MGCDSQEFTGDGSGAAMLKRPIGIIFILYIAIGVFVAWARGYLHLWLLKAILSVVLAILLWWLALLGISLHVH
jgi:hypothetical protein